MSNITANIVVEPRIINIQVDQSEIGVTVEPIDLNVSAGGFTTPGGNLGELQYNAGILQGIPNVTWDGSNLNLGDVSNIKIDGGTANFFLTTDGAGNLSFSNIIANSNFSNFAGNVVVSAQPNITSLGTLTELTVNGISNLSDVANVKVLGGDNGFVLQTDGTGNLSWTAQTGNGAGNGVPGGANTQVQFNDAGDFGGAAGFTFNKTTGNLSVPNFVIANINAANVVGTVSNANFSINANFAVNAGALDTSINDVKITGGSIGEAIVTDGTGNLSFGSTSSGKWNTVANIGINEILFGRYIGKPSLIPIMPGSSAEVSGNLELDSWDATNLAPRLTELNLGGNTIRELSSTDRFVFANLSSSTQLLRSSDGATWNSVNTGLTECRAPIQAGSDRIITWRRATTSPNISAFALFSTDQGVSWTSQSLGNIPDLGPGAFGSNVAIITTAPSALAPDSNLLVRSTDFGSTWSNISFESPTNGIVDIEFGDGKFMIIRRRSAARPVSARISDDLGNTWSNCNLPTANGSLWTSLAYGNGRWVAVSEFTGADNRAKAAVSTNDGNTWTQTFLANTNWSKVIYADDVFVASDRFGSNIIYSEDGISWTTANTELAQGGMLAYNNNLRYVVNGQFNATDISVAYTTSILVTSSDGDPDNSQAVPTGEYRNLGGSLDDSGALWIRKS